MSEPRPVTVDEMLAWLWEALDAWVDPLQIYDVHVAPRQYQAIRAILEQHRIKQLAPVLTDFVEMEKLLEPEKVLTDVAGEAVFCPACGTALGYGD